MTAPKSKKPTSRTLGELTRSAWKTISEQHIPEIQETTRAMADTMKAVVVRAPMEFAVEAQKLLGVSLEGSVG